MNLLEEIRTQENIDIEQVEKIDLEIGPVASTAAAIKEPKLGVEGKFSVWFLAALALAGAEKVLGAAIDREAHKELVDKLAAEL